jgi:hypothetical protein
VLPMMSAPPAVNTPAAITPAARAAADAFTTWKCSVPETRWVTAGLALAAVRPEIATAPAVMTALAAVTSLFLYFTMMGPSSGWIVRGPGWVRLLMLRRLPGCAQDRRAAIRRQSWSG